MAPPDRRSILHTAFDAARPDLSRVLFFGVIALPVHQAREAEMRVGGSGLNKLETGNGAVLKACGPQAIRLNTWEPHNYGLNS